VPGMVLAQGKKHEGLVAIEDSLVVYLKQLRASKEKTDLDKYNRKFSELLEQGLSLKGAFDYPFDSLRIGTIKSPDKAIRLFNWNVELPDETHKYYCFVMRYDERKKEYNVTKLKDMSHAMYRPEQKSLDAEKWYGAIYYKIIPIVSRGRKHYTLLGWDGNNKFTTKKIIDVMYFSGNNIKFGAPIFKDEKQFKRRVIFEYSSDVIVSMKYHPAKKKDDPELVIFDHLSPVNPSMEGMYEFYYPDLSFDAYKFEGGKWIYVPDVDARTGRSNLDRLYEAPEPPDTLRTGNN
jgi:hypothetical protein